MLTPANFGKIVVRQGTVAVVTDPHEIANVLGLEREKGLFSCKFPPKLKQISIILYTFVRSFFNIIQINNI